MPKQNESKWNIKELTDTEIFAAIRYLDHDSSDESLRESGNSVVVIYVSLAFLLSCAALLCLYHRAS